MSDEVLVWFFCLQQGQGNVVELFFPAGNPGKLLEIYKVSWKFSGVVCEFAHVSLILVTILVFQSVSVQNILR